MKEHLGYDKYDRSENINARNGQNNKHVITENGVIELNIPRDRDTSFEPRIVPKRQTRIELDQKILSLYVKGMSLSDIKIKLKELYWAAH